MAEDADNETDTSTETSKSAGEADKAAGSEKRGEVDYKTEYEKTLAESRKWEGRAKADKDAAEKWRKHEEESRSEEEKRAARERELEQRATAAEQRALRSEVADDKKVPVEARRFLTGSTKEELEASADELLKLISKDSGRKVDQNQGKSEGETTGDFLRDSLRH